MARNRPTNATITSIGDELEDVDTGGLNDLAPADDDLGDRADLMNDVERVCAEVGSTSDNATINIYRVDVDRKKPDAFLMASSPKEFSLERILFEYGGGNYRIRGYHPREGGGVLMFVNRIVVLEEPKRRINEPHQSAVESNSIIAAIAEMNRQNQEFMRTILLSTKPADSRESFLKEMMIMKDLFAPVRADPEPHQNPIAMLKDVMELQSNMKAFSGGDGDSGGGAMGMLGLKLLEKLGDIATASKGQRSPTPEPVYDPGATLFAPATPSEPFVNVSDEDKQMRDMIDAVIKSAESNDDAGIEFWAQSIYDQAPDALFNQLISNPLWFEGLRIYDARVSLHRAWFDKLRARVIAINNEENLTVASADVKKDANPMPTSHVPESKT